ncbi:MAG TPA: hypothetical protein VF134_02730 [Candidatus Dormibacteraeota bacterium]
MSRPRRLAGAVALALPLSQLGHALASALRHGGNPLEPGAAHRYFALDLGTVLAVLAVTLLACGMVLAAARRASGRTVVRRRSAWPLLWLFLGLAALQLELLLVQELLEGATTADVAWRGLAGQLPVAALGAVVMHWLSARLGPAVRAVRARAWAQLVALTPVATSPRQHAAQLSGLAVPVLGGRAPPVPA